MDAESISLMSWDAYDRYRILLSGLNGIYLQANSVDNPNSAVNSQTLARNLATLTGFWINQEKKIIETAIQNVSEKAVDQIKSDLNKENFVYPSNTVEENLNIALELSAKVATQLQRDCLTITQAVRQTAFRGTLQAKLKGISERLARAQLSQDTGLHYFSEDRLGKRWDSAVLVRTLYRQSLVQAWNQTAFTTLIDNGQNKGQINNSKKESFVVSLEDTSETLPTVSGIYDEIFHPNTSSWLGVYKE